VNTVALCAEKEQRPDAHDTSPSYWCQTQAVTRPRAVRCASEHECGSRSMSAEAPARRQRQGERRTWRLSNIPRHRVGSARSAGSLVGTRVGGVGEHLHDEQASERVGESRGGLARVLVEAGDRGREPAHRLLDLPDERRWLLDERRRLASTRAVLPAEVVLLCRHATVARFHVMSRSARERPAGKHEELRNTLAACPRALPPGRMTGAGDKPWSAWPEENDRRRASSPACSVRGALHAPSRRSGLRRRGRRRRRHRHLAGNPLPC
jgi:hypothetical protein